MFGLSIREILENTIINACINCKNIYKMAIANNAEALNCAETEEESAAIAMAARKEYLDAVWYNVLSKIKADNPSIHSKIQHIIMSPSTCGYEELGTMAGSLFAICFFAYKGKVAPEEVCIKLNHMQDEIMYRVLVELENEL